MKDRLFRVSPPNNAIHLCRRLRVHCSAYTQTGQVMASG
jgi:hypothetical protein